MLTREGAFPLSSVSPQNYSLDKLYKDPNGRRPEEKRCVKSFKVRRVDFASLIQKNDTFRTLKNHLAKR